MPRGQGIYRDGPRTKLKQARDENEGGGEADATDDTAATTEDATSSDPQEPPD